MNELDNLINDRREKVRLMKKDGDNSHKLLAGLYGSPTHFITELLQNAEDEGARNVRFELTNTELIFSHDAKKLFDFNDIRAISNFGDNQEKKDKSNAIGRFGIGFKSVYSITESPRIISAGFDITIRDYNIPERTNGYTNEFFQGTKIILPFKKDAREKTKELLDKELQDLNLHYLLFLSNISSIHWQTKKDSGLYQRTVNKKDKRFVTLKSSSREIKYLLFEKMVQIDRKNLVIKIAFQQSETNKKTIIACEKSSLFVFFPTKIETNLKFLIHAPFYTTPARENIQEDENTNLKSDHRNDELKIELGKLLIESISQIKSLKLLNPDFLNVLPIDKEICNRSAIYKQLYEAVKAELKSEKQFLPNSNGSFSSSHELMILRSSDLADLINSQQAKALFGRSYWLNKRITNDKTKLLRDYFFNELNIPEYDLADLANKIDTKFMVGQSDEWLMQFYKVVHKAPALWRVGTRSVNGGILRNKPIIRIETKNGIQQVVPFQTNGKPNVFLPIKEQTKYATVKQNIIKNKEAKKFFEDIGLTTPDLFAEIDEFIIPQFKTGVTYGGYFEDFKKILEASQSSNQEKRNHLIQDLKNCPFILGYNIETGETKHLKFTEVYFRSENLLTYFGGNTSVFFVAEDQYSLNVKEISKLHSLLSEVGVKTTLWKMEFNPNFSWQEKIAIRKNASISYEYYCNDYYLDGLSEFFRNEITIEKSVALWQLLIKSISNEQYPQSKFFQGEYSYKYYSDYRVNFDSYFLKQLKQTPWFVINSKHYLPSEISYSSLPDIYKSAGNETRILGDILGFKPDEIRAIEERFGGKFLTGDKLKKFEQWEAEQHNKIEPNPVNNEQEDEFEPEVNPEEAILTSRELDETEVSIEFNKQQGISPKNKDESQDERSETGSVNEDGSDEVKNEILNPRFLKEIGDWGQSYVNLDLQNEFKADATIEILDLNKSGQKGVGCDFIVKKNGEIIRLVEVKATIEKFGQTLSISGTQWEVARNCFKVNDGDKYWIYCVFNAGQENAEIVKIKNPIRKWKDGKLFAHPVNFVVK